MVISLADAVGLNPTITFFPAVNTFSIAGTILPGKWTLQGTAKKFGWQVQKGYGLSGAFLFPTGDELVVAQFRGEFWATEDWQIYRDQVRKPLLATGSFVVGGTVSSKAMGIDHPELKALGVTAVVVTEVGAGIQEDGGLWVTELEFTQFRPPIVAPPKPKTVIPDIVKPAPVAQDAQDVEIDALTKKLKEQTGS